MINIYSKKSFCIGAIASLPLKAQIRIKIPFLIDLSFFCLFIFRSSSYFWSIVFLSIVFYFWNLLKNQLTLLWLNANPSKMLSRISQAKSTMTHQSFRAHFFNWFHILIISLNYLPRLSTISRLQEFPMVVNLGFYFFYEPANVFSYSKHQFSYIQNLDRHPR